MHVLQQALEKDADDNEQFACMVTSQRDAGGRGHGGRGVVITGTNYYFHSF